MLLLLPKLDKNKIKGDEIIFVFYSAKRTITIYVCEIAKEVCGTEPQENSLCKL